MPELDLYLLVHPERYPSNDWDAILGPNGGDETAEEALASIPGGFDAAYGAHVLAAAESAARAVVLLDPMDVESLTEDAALHGIIDEQACDLSAEELRRQTADHPGADAVQVTDGAPLRAFHEALEADRFGVADAVAELKPPRPGASALLGGFARRDCVKRVANKLKDNGWRVELCPLTTMPLGDAVYTYPPAAERERA